jgi:hypothetical protein
MQGSHPHQEDFASRQVSVVSEVYTQEEGVGRDQAQHPLNYLLIR